MGSTNFGKLLEEVKNPKMKISENELEIFSDTFKDKIHIPNYITEQFDTISCLEPISEESIKKMYVKIPPPKKKKISNKTLILDLDNTLVCVMSPQTFNERAIPSDAQVKSTTYKDAKSGSEIDIKIIIRQYAIEMLKQLTTYYEIIIFTAANRVYGDAVIDQLDPDNTLIDYRLYRDNCIRTSSAYIKDLRIINRDFSSMIMVDDTITSFANQMENGIFIPPFIGTNPDNELGSLWIFLRQIALASDVRIAIAAKYNLIFFYEMHVMKKKKQ